MKLAAYILICFALGCLSGRSGLSAVDMVLIPIPFAIGVGLLLFGVYV